MRIGQRNNGRPPRDDATAPEQKHNPNARSASVFARDVVARSKGAGGRSAAKNFAHT
jgi:hypothetical protein